jgi:hypothetical protein
MEKARLGVEGVVSMSLIHIQGNARLYRAFIPANRYPSPFKIAFVILLVLALCALIYSFLNKRK